MSMACAHCSDTEYLSLFRFGRKQNSSHAKRLSHSLMLFLDNSSVDLAKTGFLAHTLPAPPEQPHQSFQRSSRKSRKDEDSHEPSQAKHPICRVLPSLYQSCLMMSDVKINITRPMEILQVVAMDRLMLSRRHICRACITELSTRYSSETALHHSSYRTSE